MFSFELVYFASFAEARLRLNIFAIRRSYRRAVTLWQFKESTGYSDLEGLQRHCRFNQASYAY